MTRRKFIVVCIFFLFGCAKSQPITPTPEISTTPCSSWEVTGADIACYALDETTFLFQTYTEQSTLRRYNASIVLHGTILLIDNNELEIFVLEGQTIIGANGQTRVVSIGHQTSISITEDLAQSISGISLISSIETELPLSILPRTIDEGAFILEPTPSPTEIPTVTLAESCDTPRDWSGVYIVQTGDTIAEIATRFDLTTDELADGNCLENISRINVGLELRVPINASISQVENQVAVGFRADNYVLASGDCTHLRWDDNDFAEVYLNDEGVTASSIEICPTETTSYVLSVVLEDDTEIISEITISVAE